MRGQITKMKVHYKKIFICLMLLVVMLLGSLPGGNTTVYAESGMVYSCTVNRSYSHPVTGQVEDSGGESSYATGQGMVEGCVYGSGLMEVTDSGSYYLTIRLGLMDYTSNQSFSVQNVGDSGWMSTGTAVTATGSDSNGTTADLCIQVPSENCIVRGSMYVTPMGRDVIFYFYPSNYSEGNSVGMTPAFVTKASGSTQGTEAGTSTDATMETSQDTSDDGKETDTSEDENTSGTTLNGSMDGTLAEGTEKTQTAESESGEDEELNSAQGLSLSTAEEVSDNSGGISIGSGVAGSIFVLASAITIAGLILIIVAAAIVYYFRKNWKRWGGEDDDEDYEE